MSGSAFLPRSRPLRIPADIAADEERDRIIAMMDEDIASLDRSKIAGANLLSQRLVAYVGKIAGGLHRG